MRLIRVRLMPLLDKSFHQFCSEVRWRQVYFRFAADPCLEATAMTEPQLPLPSSCFNCHSARINLIFINFLPAKATWPPSDFRFRDFVGRHVVLFLCPTPRSAAGLRPAVPRPLHLVVGRRARPDVSLSPALFLRERRRERARRPPIRAAR